MSRNITLSCINVPGFGLLHVANVHLSWAQHGFYQEYDNLIKLIRSRQHFGIRADVIAGDFNAPAGEQAYNHIVGNGEYADQFHECHPHRFHEPSYRGQIDGWFNYPPPTVSIIFLNAMANRCKSNRWIASLTMISMPPFPIISAIWQDSGCIDPGIAGQADQTCYFQHHWHRRRQRRVGYALMSRKGTANGLEF